MYNDMYIYILKNELQKSLQEIKKITYEKSMNIWQLGYPHVQFHHFMYD